MIRVNLLPVKEIRAEFGRRQQMIIAAAALGLTVAILASVNLYQFYRASSLKKELAGLRAEIEQLTAQEKGVRELEQKVGGLQSKLKVIDELNEKKTGPVRVMESLSSVTPQRLWLTLFKETAGALTLDGLAIDNQTIADFLKALSGSPYFSGVDLVETTQVEQDKIPLKKFSIKANIVYQPPPAQDAQAAKK
jgi:type IV pilus assembly protein PilN